MRRLFLQIYLGFVAIALLFLVAAALLWAWHGVPGRHAVPPYLAGAVGLLAEKLPAQDRPRSELQAALAAEAERLSLHLTVWSADGAPLASAGRPLPAPRIDAGPRTWIRGRHGPPGVAIRLADGRWLGLALDRSPGEAPRAWLLGLALLCGVIAVGSYPIARRLARRLERLRSSVEELGAGNLSARVAVEGHDEVSDVARSFNRAADRIQALVHAQRRMLASASHELRSPLARLRLAVELMGAESRPELRTEAETNIRELDSLIEDLLLAGRLDSSEPSEAVVESVDLLALVAEEAARVGAELSGQETVVRGEARLLRRMTRNLLENAQRYGGGTPIEATVSPTAGGGASLTVADRGPGVPESERSRIFEPFYRPEGHSEGRDGGVGLGLALVREIARHHAGEVSCLPRPGGGTLFVVDLRGLPES
jgi:signal transduction histidine kinase